MRRAIKDLAQHGECYVVHRQRTAELEVRMARGGNLELNRFVETAASNIGISISESSEIAPVDVDRYTQRALEIKLRKVTIDQLAKLVKELEAGPAIVQVTRLNVTTRWNQNQDLDVEMVVSTFERRQETRPAGAGRKRGRS